MRSVHPVVGPGTRAPMDRNELNALAAELKAEIANPPNGVDRQGLEAMLDLIQDNLPKNTASQVAGVGASRETTI